MSKRFCDIQSYVMNELKRNRAKIENLYSNFTETEFYYNNSTNKITRTAVIMKHLMLRAARRNHL